MVSRLQEIKFKRESKLHYYMFNLFRKTKRLVYNDVVDFILDDDNKIYVIIDKNTKTFFLSRMYLEDKYLDFTNEYDNINLGCIEDFFINIIELFYDYKNYTITDYVYGVYKQVFTNELKITNFLHENLNHKNSIVYVLENDYHIFSRKYDKGSLFYLNGKYLIHFNLNGIQRCSYLSLNDISNVNEFRILTDSKEDKKLFYKYKSQFKKQDICYFY